MVLNKMHLTDAVPPCAVRGGSFLRTYPVLWAIALLLAFVAVSVTEAAPKATAKEPAAKEAASTNAGSLPAKGETANYIIGPGDSIQVFVWRNPELTVIVPVRPDGKISTPLVDDMVAVGKSPSQLARDLETVLSEYVRSPKVSIIVNSTANVLNQVRVIGQVESPQSLAFHEGMTALDAVMSAGGLTEFAAGNRAYILRKGGEGKDMRIAVKVQDLLKGKLATNVPLKAGDSLVVPESWF